MGTLPEQFARWFAARGWQPRPHQLAMLDAARDNASALLIAPTGGGKTLAGFLPSLVELAAAPFEGLHTLYISPLKALAVDIARNLTAPVADMGLSITIEIRTGDTPANRRARQRENPPNILLTTPESLTLLLSLGDAEVMFRSLRCVVLDEIHALAGTKRGDQLFLCLSRLTALAPDARHVGLSATVAHPQALRAHVARDANPESVRLIEVAGGAPPEIGIQLPEGRLPWGGHMGLASAPEIYRRIATAGVTIIFVNTRAQAELVFAALWKLNEDALPIALHHGSLTV
ncbi:MAG: DEAD/DEAH box helicase, partial [Rubritepida sp.]|nr:DEAD/DEAH box helicase [Rubritepida sp.]